MALVSRNMDELRKQRDLLLGRAWVTMSEAERASLIEAFCEGYILPPLGAFAPTAYRARLNDEGALYSKIEELQAPRAEFVKKAGRLNRAVVSTLYLAAQPIAAIFETRPSIGATVSVLAYRTKSGAPIWQLAPVAMTRLRETSHLGPIDPMHSQGALGFTQFADLLKANGLTEQWSLQNEVFGDLLVLDPPLEQQEALYDLTNGIQEHLYRTYPGYEGVQYPGIVTRLSAPNISLNKDRWNDVEPLEVWVTKVSEELFEHSEGSTIAFTQPLVAFGKVQFDGLISYAPTTKTLVEAANDFKQKYGRVARPEGMKPILQRPHVRYRISYGGHPDWKRYDVFLT